MVIVIASVPGGFVMTRGHEPTVHEGANSPTVDIEYGNTNGLRLIKTKDNGRGRVEGIGAVWAQRKSFGRQ